MSANLNLSCAVKAQTMLRVVAGRGNRVRISRLVGPGCGPWRITLRPGLTAACTSIALLPTQTHAAHPSHTSHSPDPSCSSTIIAGADNGSPRTDVAGRDITPSLAVVTCRDITSSHTVVGSRCIVAPRTIVAGSIGVLIDRRRIGIDGRIVVVIVGVGDCSTGAMRATNANPLLVSGCCPSNTPAVTGKSGEYVRPPT